MTPELEALRAADAATATDPTPAQAQAGNYAKGKLHLHGLEIRIENPKGSTRSGVSADGKAWSTKMTASYGYVIRMSRDGEKISGTVSEADGDHLDVFIGDHPEGDTAYVVDQIDPKTGKFDEHKVVLGVLSKRAAKVLYMSNYASGWKGFEDITPLTMAQLKNWIDRGDTSKRLAGASFDFRKRAAYSYAQPPGTYHPCSECGGEMQPHAKGDPGHGFRGSIQCQECEHTISAIGQRVDADVKRASTGGKPLLHYVPEAALESVKRHGLLSRRDIVENHPEVLADIAAEEGRTPDEQSARLRELMERRPHTSGVSAVFSPPPDVEALDELHPLRTRNLVPVEIDYDALLADRPETKPHGVELTPWGSGRGRRHRDLRDSELRDLLAMSPEALWAHYEDPQHDGMYAPSVPHVILPETVDPKYLRFPKAASFDPLPYNQWIFAGCVKSAVVKQEAGAWKLYTRDGRQVLGTHDTAREAYAQEYAIQKSQEAAAGEKNASGRKRTHAVDLDGTLATKERGPFDSQHIGEPIEPMMKRVKDWIAAGDEVVIFTARAADPDNIPPVVEWLERHGIGECEVTNEKQPHHDDFWDDRAVSVERNTGKVIKAASVKYATGMAKYASARPAVVTDRSQLPFRESAEALLYDNGHLVGQIADGADNSKFIKFPGGGIDEGEDIHQGLLRELMEEAGAEPKDLIGHGTSQIVWPEDMAKAKPDKYNRWQGSRRHVFSGRLASQVAPTSTEGDALTGHMRIPVHDALRIIDAQIADPDRDGSGSMLEHRKLQRSAIMRLVAADHPDSVIKAAGYIPVEHAHVKAASVVQKIKDTAADWNDTAAGAVQKVIAPGTHIANNTGITEPSVVNPQDFKRPAYGDQFNAQLSAAQAYNTAQGLPNTTAGWRRPVPVFTGDTASVRFGGPHARTDNGTVHMPTDIGKFITTPGHALSNLTAEQNAALIGRDVLAHEVRHAAGQNPATDAYDKTFFAGTADDPETPARLEYLSTQSHDAQPAEMRNYLSSIQEQRFKDTGKRITTPEEYDAMWQSWNMGHPDPKVFEDSIKSVPVDAQRMLRQLRRGSTGGSYLKQVKDWQRRIMPGIVSTAPVDTIKVAGMKCPACGKQGKVKKIGDGLKCSECEKTSDIDDWFTKSATGEHPILPMLRDAKAHSDAGRMEDKAGVMRALLTDHGDEFMMDGDDDDHVAGLTHVPTGFRIHLPKSEIPARIRAKSAASAHVACDCGADVDLANMPEVSMGAVACPQCGKAHPTGYDKSAMDWSGEMDRPFCYHVDGRMLTMSEAKAYPREELRMMSDLTKSASAAAVKPSPTTGPEALLHHLKRINLDALEAAQHALIKSGKTSKRDAAVRKLNIIEGLRRNELTPDQLMIRKVPVVPAVFRPFSVAGQTFIPGDANELYRDLFVHRRLHDEAIKELGPDAAGEATTNLYAALKAVHGFGEPVNDKARARGVSGFFQQITGTSPKFGFVNRRLLSKPVDQVSRATITVNPDLGMDEVGLPREQAWTMFGSKLQRHLVLRGFSPADAAVSVRDRDQHASRALEDLVPNHPVVVARAPAWHKFNTIGAWPKLVDGSTLQLNPYITAGQGADFDGDQMNTHVPITDEEITETKEKLMPSKMLFSIRNPDSVMAQPKHEALLGLAAAGYRAPQKNWQFESQDAALAAIRRGDVPLHDDVTFPGSDEMQAPPVPVATPVAPSPAKPKPIK